MQTLKPYINVDFTVPDQPVIGVAIKGTAGKYLSKFTDSADDTKSALVLTYQISGNTNNFSDIDDVIRVTTDLRNVTYSLTKYPRITVKVMNGNSCIGTSSTYFVNI